MTGFSTGVATVTIGGSAGGAAGGGAVQPTAAKVNASVHRRNKGCRGSD